MSAIPDLGLSRDTRRTPGNFESRLKYNGALTRAAMRDPTVHRLWAEVQQLLKPPSVLQDPAVDRFVQVELFQMAAECRLWSFQISWSACWPFSTRVCAAGCSTSEKSLHQRKRRKC